MQDQILKYFETDRSWQAGVNLYNSLPDRMQSFSRSLSRMNGTGKDLEHLHYRLWQYTGLPPRLMVVTLEQKLKEIAESEPETKEEIVDKTGGVDHTNLSEEVKKELVSQEISGATDLEKASIKIRDQFPFLGKDDCPNEFKILVGDLITAFNKYREARKTLFENTDEALWSELAKEVVTKYELRKDIFAELEHYQTTGEVLGKHPLFVREAKKEKLRTQNAGKLSKRKDTLERGIRRDQKEFDKPNGKNKDNVVKRMEEKKWELDFVNQLLKNR